MNHRESLHVGTNLGDSTSCLLTFQLDEEIDVELYKMTLRNDTKLRSSTAPRVRNDEVVQTTGSCGKTRASTAYRGRGDDSVEKSRCKPRSSTANRVRSDEVLQTTGTTGSSWGKTRASTAYRVRDDDSVQKISYKPRSSTAHRLRCDDTPSGTGKPLPRTKSGETSTSRSRNTYHDNESTLTTSVTSATEYTIHPRSSGPIETVVSKPKEYHCPHTPTERSRPAIRTHRSGSFALRQFKEKHDQTQNRRSKRKTESRSRGSMKDETIDAVSEKFNEWVKSPLHPDHSVDGSFSLPHCSSETFNETSDETSPGLNHRSKEYNGEMNFTRNMVEVAPGYSALMCGIDESMNALHLDRIIQAECTSCNTFLACINVASMVLCPGCKSVSPLESPGHSFDCVPIMGLGLRIKDIIANSPGK